MNRKQQGLDDQRVASAKGSYRGLVLLRPLCLLLTICTNVHRGGRTTLYTLEGSKQQMCIGVVELYI